MPTIIHTKRRAYACTTALICCLGVGCASAPKAERPPPENQAVNQTRPGPAGPRALQPATTTHPKTAAKPGAQKIDWQAFFAPPPTQARQTAQAKEGETKTWPLRQTSNEPKTPKQWLAAGQMAIAAGQWKTAESYLQGALRRGASESECLLALSQVAIKQNQTDRAFSFLKQLDRLIRTTEEPPDVLVLRYNYVQALAYIQQRHWQKARAILSGIIERHMDFGPAYTALAKTYIDLEKFEAATFVLKRGQDAAGDSPAFFNLKGVLDNKKGRWLQAEQSYRKALELQDSYLPARANLARSLAEQGRWTEAESMLSQSIRKGAQHPQLMLLLAVIHKQMGKWQSSENLLRQALSILPKNPELRYHLALLMRKKKQYAEASRLFHEVMQISPKSTQLNAKAQDQINEMNLLGTM